MYNLVFSGTCGSGGLFHDGIGGKSTGDFALAASGKYSRSSGGGFSGFEVLYRGCGFRPGFSSGVWCEYGPKEKRSMKRVRVTRLRIRGRKT